MPGYIIPALSIIDGLICIFLAIFAHEIGLDPTATWGRGRSAMVAMGIMLICVFPIWMRLKASRGEPANFFSSETVKTFFVLGHLWGLILLIYIWFITFGNFTTWTNTTHYYTQLADAFGKGQLYVDLKPGRALAEAPDPFNPTDRPPFSDEVWDMSLYQGKLYLYWGPVPALLITPLQLIFEKKITDNYLVFFFFAGLLIVNSLIILKLKDNFFPKLHPGSMFICIALIGLILPVSWSLNIPNVYEAAIGAGQFFLLAGIYCVLTALEEDSYFNSRSLFFAGLFWSCAVGSRAINVLSVVFLAAFSSLWFAYRMSRPIRWTKYLQSISALYTPLLIGALAIGWYNWARFDSPLEFGLRYQITIFNQNKDVNLVFESSYILLNTFVYLFQPFEIISRFPFILPITASTTFNQLGIVTPHLYAAGPATGFLFSAPFLAFSLVHLFSKTRGSARGPAASPTNYAFVIALLAGTFLINFFILLFYYFGQMRFLVDVISQITLLAITGYWQVLSHSKAGNPSASKSIIFLAHILIVITFCTSFLLALTSETGRMEKLNPALFDKINSSLSISK